MQSITNNIDYKDVNITITLDELLNLIEQNKKISNNIPDTCKHCQYYNKPMWILPECHPCNNCPCRKSISTIVSCYVGNY